MQKRKMPVWVVLQIAVKRREAKNKAEQERQASECRVPKNSKKR